MEQSKTKDFSQQLALRSALEEWAGNEKIRLHSILRMKDYHS